MLSNFRASEPQLNVSSDGQGPQGERALLTSTPSRSRALFNNNNVPSNKGYEIVPDGGRAPMSGLQGRRTFAFWTLVTLLLFLAAGNLGLTFIILGVLRLSQGMESIELVPAANTIKFYGLADLGHVYKRDGLISGFTDSPVHISSDGGSVAITIPSGRTNGKPEIRILASGTNISFMSAGPFKVINPATGETVFSTASPVFDLKDGTKNLNAKMASTGRVVSPMNANLTLRSDLSAILRGAEGTRLTSDRMEWTADKDIILKVAANGSLALGGRGGVFVDVSNIPIVKMTNQNTGEMKQNSDIQQPVPQYKVCVCMPEGRLFRVAVPKGGRASCSHINMAPGHNPCA